MTRTRFRLDGISVHDQFTTMSVNIKKPTRLCLAADKNGEGIIDPDAQTPAESAFSVTSARD